MIWRILQSVYTVIFTCLLPVVFFRLWVRSLRLPAYRRRWAERLGIIPLPPLEDVMWLHAVSVGEAIAAIPLVHRFHQQYPKSPILITTTTPTGSDRVQAAFKDMLGKHIYHCYLPYDLPFILNRFFKRVKPKLLILMETEIWPNLLQACKARQLPVLIANGRLSPVSMRRYQRLGGLMKWIVSPISAVAAQSAMDVERFARLGVAPEKICDTGNIKFDLQLPAYLPEAGGLLRQELGNERLIWIAASTHETEEAIALNVYQALKPRFPELLLFLVPRHPDRFNKVANLCLDRGFNVARRSLKQSTTTQTDVYVGDTMGELPLFYAASDVAFVGGSFVAVGGHNLLEPAALGLPVISGPQLFNFVAISQMLIGAKGALAVNNEAELTAALAELLASEERRTSMGTHAQKVVEENKGALDKLLHVIEQLWCPPVQVKSMT